jgi:hypothetical protein
MMHIVCAVHVGWNDIGIPYVGEIRFIDADGKSVRQRICRVRGNRAVRGAGNPPPAAHPKASLRSKRDSVRSDHGSA